MATFKVVLDRESCIGAGACEKAFSERWKMNDNDGKVDLIGGETTDKEQVLEISEHELDRMLEAAQSCPVNAIHIIDENGDRLI